MVCKRHASFWDVLLLRCAKRCLLGENTPKSVVLRGWATVLPCHLLVQWVYGMVAGSRTNVGVNLASLVQESTHEL